MQAPSSSAKVDRGIPRAALAAIAGFVLISQAIIQATAHDSSVFARVPISDAAVYWEWSGRVAAGELVGSEPFFSAPLYPYFLGLLRALGLGLAGILAVQALLFAATAVLLAHTTARLFGARKGVLAAVLFVLCLDVAFAPGRLLNGTLQLFLTVVTWSALLRHSTAQPGRTALGSGLLLGLLCLAHPPMLVSIPLVALWVARGDRLREALTLTAGALLAIAPATVHNLVASGELIPISAQAGVTFYHGNQPGAAGVYTAAAGVSTDRVQQNRDAREAASASKGHEVSWRETSAYYRDKGLAWWRAEPGSALVVATRKLGYFLSGKYYGDIYTPKLERSSWLSALWLAPLDAAIFVGVGLLSLLLAWRSNRSGTSVDVLMVLVPLVVVVVFWYSPRYRLPALPILAAYASWGLCKLTDRSVPRAIRIAFCLALVPAMTPVSSLVGIDDLQDQIAQLELSAGHALLTEGDLAGARVRFELARAHGADSADSALADLQRLSGDFAGAIELLRQAALERPQDPYTLRSLATALAEGAMATQDSTMLEEARVVFEQVLSIDPRDWRAWLGLANVQHSLGQPRAAVSAYDRGLEIAPAHEQLELRWGRAAALGVLEDWQASAAAWRSVLALDRERPAVYSQLANVLHAAEQPQDAVEVLREGLAELPGHPRLTLDLTWWLAAAPDEQSRAPGEVLRLLDSRAEGTLIEEIEALDVRAAAQAAQGAFMEAIQTAERALDMLMLEGRVEWAARVRERLDGYRERRPYILERSG